MGRIAAAPPSTTLIEKLRALVDLGPLPVLIVFVIRALFLCPVIRYLGLPRYIAGLIKGSFTAECEILR